MRGLLFEFFFLLLILSVREIWARVCVSFENPGAVSAEERPHDNLMVLN